MTITRTSAFVLAAALFVGACGGSDDSDVADDVVQETAVEETASEETAVDEPAVDEPAAAEEDADEAVEDTADTEEEPAEEEPAEETDDEPVVEEEPAEVTIWDVAPRGDGCMPGTPDSLPDGEWYGFAVGFENDAIAFDLVCSWISDDLFEAGAITEDEFFPNDYIVNDNPTIRNLKTSDEGIGISYDENFEQVDFKLQNGWGDGHKAFGQTECPSEACYAVVTIEGGHVVEIREIYLS